MNQLPLLVAHRCGAGLRAENTIAALRHAIDLGVDGVEVDVHVSADDVVVVHHDFRLNPTFAAKAGAYIAGEGPPIRCLRAQEIQEYTVGEPDPTIDGVWQNDQFVPIAGEQIPTLDEVACLIAETSVRLLVEIKSDVLHPDLSAPPTVLARAVCDVLARARCDEQASVISFDWRVLEEVQTLSPTVKTGFLTVGRRGDYPGGEWFGSFDPKNFGGSFSRAIAAAGGSFWSPAFGDLTPSLCKEAHDNGLQVSVWTCNERREIQRMVECGADLLTTDRPDVVRSVFAEISQ